MALDMFSSTSQTEQRTSDNDVAASDQAVVLQRSVGGDRNSGNTRINVRKGGAYNVTNTTTLDTSGLEEKFTSLANLLARPASPVTGLPAVSDEDPVTERINDTVTQAPADAAAKKTKIGIVIVAILAILLGAIILRRRKS